MSALSGPVLAQGYILDELSVRRLGDAFSGGAAEARDASSAYYNPAGLTLLDKEEIVVGAIMLGNHLHFNGGGEAYSPGLNNGATPTTGEGDFDYRSHDVVPNFYYSLPLKNHGAIGVAFNVPTASTTELPETTSVRYQNIYSSLVGMRLTLSLAEPVTDKLSLALGVALQQMNLENRTAVDSYAQCEVNGLPALGLTHCGVPSDIQRDGRSELKVDELAWGYTWGALYRFNDATRVGVAYHSRIEHHLEGDLNLSLYLQSTSPDFTEFDTKARLTMNSPESMSFSVFHALTPRLNVQADATWTGWSIFNVLDVQTDLGINQRQPQHWQDTWRYAVGGDFAMTPAWTLRAGIDTDPSPIPQAYRSLSFPMNDFVAASVGTSYAFSPALTLDVALQRTMPFSSHTHDGDLISQGGESNGLAKGSTFSFGTGLRWQI